MAALWQASSFIRTAFFTPMSKPNSSNKEVVIEKCTTHIFPDYVETRYQSDFGNKKVVVAIRGFK
jgi:hypothetical protein